MAWCRTQFAEKHGLRQAGNAGFAWYAMPKPFRRTAVFACYRVDGEVETQRIGRSSKDGKIYLAVLVVALELQIAEKNAANQRGHHGDHKKAARSDDAISRIEF